MDSDDELHDADERSKLVLEAMRHLADQQLERAERVRSFSRQTFVYVAALFTVAQTVTLTSFAASSVSSSERVFILIPAIAAAVLLGVAGLATLNVDRLREVRDFGVADILREAGKAERDPTFSFADRLGKLYADSAEARAAAVETRREATFWGTVAASLTIFLVVAEVVISLITRLA
jgi:hypothetical protein